MDGWVSPVNNIEEPFTVATFGTPSIGTGPSQAAVGTGYIHAETSGGNTFKEFNMGKNFPAKEIYGVAFYYHMYGATIGSAKLETSGDNGMNWVGLWSKTGDKGDQWFQATVYTPAFSSMDMLKFTCVPHSLPRALQS